MVKKISEDVPTNNISGGKVAGTTADSVGVSVKAQNKYRLKNMRNAPGSMLRRKSPVTEEKEFKLGDNVHLGLATKGGAGFKGRLIKINGDEVLVRAHTQNKFGTRVWKGSKKNLSLDEAFKNWTVEFKPGDKVKVISGDHTGKRGMVLSKHDRGSAYTIKHTDGSIMKHHISTLDSHIYS